jgi:hypothetical protein
MKTPMASGIQGHYLKKQKPEAVYHFPPLIDVRANWELQEQFILE